MNSIFVRTEEIAKYLERDESDAGMNAVIAAVTNFADSEDGLEPPVSVTELWVQDNLAALRQIFSGLEMAHQNFLPLLTSSTRILMQQGAEDARIQFLCNFALNELGTKSEAER
jgi:hypothetical protein